MPSLPYILLYCLLFLNSRIPIKDSLLANGYLQQRFQNASIAYISAIHFEKLFGEWGQSYLQANFCEISSYRWRAVRRGAKVLPSCTKTLLMSGSSHLSLSCGKVLYSYSRSKLSSLPCRKEFVEAVPNLPWKIWLLSPLCTFENLWKIGPIWRHDWMSFRKSAHYIFGTETQIEKY